MKRVVDLEASRVNNSTTLQLNFQHYKTHEKSKLPSQCGNTLDVSEERYSDPVVQVSFHPPRQFPTRPYYPATNTTLAATGRQTAPLFFRGAPSFTSQHLLTRPGEIRRPAGRDIDYISFALRTLVTSRWAKYLTYHLSSFSFSFPSVGTPRVTTTRDQATTLTKPPTADSVEPPL